MHLLSLTDTNSQLCVTMREYYCYKFQMRRGIFNTILHGKRLFQQFDVDTYIKLETTRLNYILHNQSRIRADLYQGLVDTLCAGEVRARRVGKRWVLPASFIGGGRDMRRRYMDAMALVQKYGKPDFFLTMTCNPNWEEIVRELEPGQTPQDRPDLVVRVFKAKLEDLKHQLFHKHILGVVAAQVHVIEFQKRGLPHAHFLLIMQSPYKLTSPEQYDAVISAELPNKDKYPQLREMVAKHMMHGPCGSLNRRSPCMRDGQCKCHYPRQFQTTTLQGKDSYPIYRRREDGETELVRGHDMDNRWVVPYCPKLLRRYDCHLNVEVCSSIQAVKYLYKYIYKGHDRASVSVNDADGNQEINEIENFRDARWVGPQEALWRIYGFDLNGISPPVLQLQLHLPGMHLVSYNENADVRNVLEAQGVEKSMLTQFFKANQEFPWARTLLYREFPEHAVWESRPKKWKPRQQRTQVGRIISAHPAEGERYYLRVLLNHVRGPTSYEHLRSFEGIVYPTFREAAEKRGLIEADSSIDECLTEAEVFHMPSSLRRLFATILVFCEPSNVRGLWDKHLQAMSDDFQRGQSDSNAVQQMVLIDIRNILQSMGKDITLFPLPEISGSNDDMSGVVREIFEETNIELDNEHLSAVSYLNREQRQAYDTILASVDSGTGGVFFVDGPGGTGKTFLYNAMLARVRSNGNIAIATATSGVAASIMPGGRTAHSRFKIPLSIQDGGVCNFTKQSGTATLLRRASLILWDEATMTKRQAIEALDKSMRDIMDKPGLPFGGKTIVFGGDFRQVLPVVRKGTRAQIINSTLRRSYLWDYMHQLRLVQNMRAQSDPWFSDYLLRIGNGVEETIDQDYVRLPSDICVPYTGEESNINDLIDVVFPMLEENMTNSNYITSRAILSTRNENVDGINMKLIERFPGQQMIYHSFDCAVDDPNNHYPSEFLNSLTPNGLPPHILKLKVNCPVILLRNLDPPNGLCNGTRLVVRAFQRNTIDAEIVLGQHAGKRVFLPRIPLCPSDDEMFPFRFKRKQFPVRVSFAMTINKAQGQTIPHVGVYLPNPVFSHGQLYVAMSRATARSRLKVLAATTNDEISELDGTLTKNIVYKEVLTS